jgi:hypothetical protein
MRVKIEKVSVDDTRTTVSFSTTLGSAVAEWLGQPPRLHEEYDVELEIPGRLTWGDSIHQVHAGREAIESGMGTVGLVGRIVSVDEDGCLALQIGDSIVLVDATGVPSDVQGFLQVVIPLLRLHPVEL